MEPTVIYEDNHLLAINKPARLLVQADRTGDPTAIDWGKAYLKEKYHKPGEVFLHAAHRLDRPVSGALLLARTDKALDRLNAIFKSRQIEKNYFAWALRPPRREQGELRHFLIKNEEKNRVQAYPEPVEGSKESVLNYTYLGALHHLHLLLVRPLTGRPHQIRVQLASIGCIIAGDLKYGAPEPLSDASIGLHCRSMHFVHPVKKTPLTVTAPWPDAELWEDIDSLAAGR